ncbi:hypothetical protein EPA93_11030 [Ktedonosporobacter rubrisoli]|uniref:Blue (type 1) copper domain-containing protein n=1 Tax=Ktedonosporobacter rubrisoli TaxID=2509675 RepID=A0A4P6JMZ6_KTERU|nr:plastocyanin/azurin family copper-binding protein [Ktedonosporobacter rubrisoli]QBD76513.1 hypothetical protein EPA93_11030 [Ktedonosporobacter rubrisoli]
MNEGKSEQGKSVSRALHAQHAFSRQSLSAFSKIVIVALSGAAAASFILAVVVGFPDNNALLFVTMGLIITAGLAVTGFRWMPPVITLVNGIFLYEMTTQPYVAYHLSNPKTGGFANFVLDLVIIAFVFVAFGAAIGATIQLYRPDKQQVPRWLPAALTGVAGIVIGALFIASIAQTGSAARAANTMVRPAGTTVGATTTTGNSSLATVHMSAANFDQPSVTLSKGAKLRLVDDTSIPHVLANGTWQNGVPKPAVEPGAPLINQVQVNGNSVDIGPFTTAGTYHIYCPIHQGMNLTVVVQ